MGNVCGAEGAKGTKEEKEINARIEKELRQNRKDMELEIKMLLLGAGESGKSTIAKQIKIIFMSGFSKNELMAYRPVIYNNAILGMRTMIIEGQERLGIHIPSSLKSDADEFAHQEIALDAVLTPALGQSLSRLWKSVEIQAIFNRRCEFQLPDSVAYFCDNAERISQPNYEPTEEDVLQARARTVGIKEIGFSWKGHTWRIVDVGGQRTERRKWIHCFEDVTAIIYCTDASGYNLRLFEDDRVNRTEECFTLFKEIANCRYFESTPIILFLNKSDLLEKKITQYHIADYFPEYKGRKGNFDDAVAWLKAKYSSLNQVRNKTIYIHVTNATNTKNIEYVWMAVQDIIMVGILKEANVMPI